VHQRLPKFTPNASKPHISSGFESTILLHLFGALSSSIDPPVFARGKLRLKSKKPKSAAAKEVTEASPPSVASLPAAQSNLPSLSIVDSLTPAEAKFLAVNNLYKRKQNSVW
jgi:hypothetical protein